MNKAFIFDMDGVLINSERTWDKYEKEIFNRIFGEKIAAKIGDTLGLGPNKVYERAVEAGFKESIEYYYKELDKEMDFIYSSSKLTNKIDFLAEKLKEMGFKIGLVSASRLGWIHMVLPRLKFEKDFSVIISTDDSPHLKSKPHPDGYLEAIEKLKASPETTIVLEDSNHGIKSGKDAGAYVIGFREHLLSGFVQTGADAYADNVSEVIKLVEEFLKRHD